MKLTRFLIICQIAPHSTTCTSQTEISPRLQNETCCAFLVWFIAVILPLIAYRDRSVNNGSFPATPTSADASKVLDWVEASPREFYFKEEKVASPISDPIIDSYLSDNSILYLCMASIDRGRILISGVLFDWYGARHTAVVPKRSTDLSGLFGSHEGRNTSCTGDSGSLKRYLHAATFFVWRLRAIARQTWLRTWWPGPIDVLFSLSQSTQNQMSELFTLWMFHRCGSPSHDGWNGTGKEANKNSMTSVSSQEWIESRALLVHNDIRLW